MLKKINNIKLILELLRDDAMTKDVDTKAILEVSKELEEILKEGYGLKEADEEK